MSVQPLREVVRLQPHALWPYTLVETLACGHALERAYGTTAAKRRRCVTCRPESDPRALVQLIARESENDPIAGMTPESAAKYLRERAAYLDSGGWAPHRAEALRSWADRLDAA